MLRSIRISDIPPCLHRGAFYRSLGDGDLEMEIEIPEECCGSEIVIRGLEDLARALRVMLFWMLDEIPLEIIEFLDDQPFEYWGKAVSEILDKTELWDVLKQVFDTENEEGHDGKLVEAIKTNHSDLIEYLAAQTVSKDSEAAIQAARMGKLDTLMLLHEYGHPWDKLACNEAAGQNHLECLQYLHYNGCPWDHEVYVYAGRRGFIECVKYAHQEGLPWQEYVSWEISKMGHLSCLQYALDNGCPCDVRAVKFAVIDGHVDCVRCLLLHGSPVDTGACMNAASGGQIECLKLLCEFNTPLDANVTANAANFNQLACLQYLNERGCPWDERVTDSAASRGLLPILQYALQNRCPCDGDNIVLRAAMGGTDATSLACLRFLIEDENMHMNTDGSVFVEAFIRGRHECVRYLLEVGCPCAVTTDVVRHRWSEVEDGLERVRDFDAKIDKCIVCAVQRGWDIHQNGAELIEVIMLNEDMFPMSSARCAALPASMPTGTPIMRRMWSHRN